MQKAANHAIWVETAVCLEKAVTERESSDLFDADYAFVSDFRTETKEKTMDYAIPETEIQKD